MPATSAHPLRPRPAVLRALAGGMVLAGALSTLAGGNGFAVWRADEAAAAPARVLPTPGHATADTGTGDGVVDGPAGHSLTGDLGGTQTAHRAMPRSDPPPYAPGGDDLLSTGEAATAVRGQAGIGGTGPALRPPPPVLWLERTTVRLGETAVLHVAVPQAGMACWGTGALAGLGSVGPRMALRVTTPGQHRLAVACGVAGAAAEAAVVLTVPLLAAVSSHDSRQAQDLDMARLPSLHQLGLRPPTTADGANEPVLALGDFLQQGRQAMFVVAAGPEGAAWAHVMARDAAGRWTDRSADLLEPAQRTVCPTAAQAISSDFNRDGLPDVWIACEGRQLLFLSQADGHYHRLETPFSLKAQQAEARDVDGDGWPDVVTLDTSSGLPRTLLLLGRGDGRFDTGPAEAWRVRLPDQRR